MFLKTNKMWKEFIISKPLNRPKNTQIQIRFHQKEPSTGLYRMDFVGRARDLKIYLQPR